MRRTRAIPALAWLAAIFVATAPRADVVSEPVKVSDAKLKAFIEQKCGFETAMEVHRFHKGGAYEGSAAMGAQMKGTWKVSQGALVVEATGTGGPCAEEDCDQTWSASFRWNKLKLNKDSSLLVLENKGGGAEFYLCEQGQGCAGKDADKCRAAAEPLLIRPGHSDRALYEKVRAHYAKTPPGDPVIEGAPAKNPRETTEIWYLEQSSAQYVAGVLEPIVGPVTPKQWTWGGPYGVIVIVGKDKAR